MNKTLNATSAIILFLVIALAIPLNLSAKGKGTPKKQDPVVHDTVSQVDDTSITVAGKKDSKTYAITSFTEINVDGQHATAKSIQVGMLVMVGADSNGKATLINAHIAPKPAKTTGKGS